MSGIDLPQCPTTKNPRFKVLQLPPPSDPASAGVAPTPWARGCLAGRPDFPTGHRGGAAGERGAVPFHDLRPRQHRLSRVSLVSGWSLRATARSACRGSSPPGPSVKLRQNCASPWTPRHLRPNRTPPRTPPKSPRGAPETTRTRRGARGVKRRGQALLLAGALQRGESLRRPEELRDVAHVRSARPPHAALFDLVHAGHEALPGLSPDPQLGPPAGES